MKQNITALFWGVSLEIWFKFWLCFWTPGC